MKKRKILRIIIYVVMILFFFLFILSLYKIIVHLKDNKENKRIQKSINENIVKVIESSQNDEHEEIKYEINFKLLKETNKDTIAYIKVNNTDIEYVIVRGKDNSYYLNHNFENKKNTAGWIFADYHNKFDETDQNIVIYGHNTKDGSMFGTLKNVLNKDWYNNEENRKILLVTEKGTYYYKTFSTYSVKPEEYYINTQFKDTDEFGVFVNRLKSRSLYNYNVDVNSQDKILTLSSCIDSGSKRVVLHAKLIND